MKKELALLILIVTAALAPYAVPSAPSSARIIVGYEDESILSIVEKVTGAAPLKKIPEIRAAVFVLPSEAVERVKRLRGVRYVEVDGVAVATEFSSYPDVLWNVKMVGADKVWDALYPSIKWAALGRGVVVAVLDTGVEYTHPELVGKVAWCALTVGTRTYTGNNLRNCIDRNGHGTHVAGIIAATINSVGNAGVAPNVTIYAVKVLNDAGQGTYSDIAEGIILA